VYHFDFDNNNIILITIFQLRALNTKNIFLDSFLMPKLNFVLKLLLIHTKRIIHVEYSVSYNRISIEFGLKTLIYNVITNHVDTSPKAH
jgi:hypothetical protein